MEAWEQGKIQALEKCRKLGLDDSTIVNSLARCMMVNQFQIAAAIKHIMDYAFSIKSISFSEELERFYPISKEYICPNVFGNYIIEMRCSYPYGWKIGRAHV